MAVRNSQVKGPANRRAFDRLHVRVVGAVATLWDGPCDVLAWVFDIAGFAMHAVLEVNLEAWLFAFFCDHFVNACRTVALGGLVKFGQVDRDWHGGVFERQVRGLAFFMVGEGKCHVGQAVERQFAVGF
jgi:hypothetical protein